MPSRSEDEKALQAAAEFLRTLGSPVRLMIVRELSAGERCVHELVEASGRMQRPASQSLISQHLRVLRGAGLVVAQRRGQEIAYNLVDHHIAEIATDAIMHALEPAQRGERTMSRE